VAEPGSIGVQSVERAFDILESLSDSGGELGLSQLVAASDLPLSTIHRLMRTLVRRGYARQLPSRRYALGPALVRLGESASGLLGEWARPHLRELVESLGETANLAMLDGDKGVYVAQVPSKHAMRMFTEVGRRVHLHSTGVGKALLAQLDDPDVRALVRRTGMPAATDHTITDIDILLGELARIRADGYAVDDGEQEKGVRCFAVALPGTATPTAISVSGPDSRVTLASAATFVPRLRAVASDLANDLAKHAS
jgi:IclR family acetate operon transcriptional repressor